MPRRIRPRLSYANVMSSIAVFVVLGGGAYATIDRKITTSDLKNGAVSTKKIKKKAVRAGKLAQNSVRTGKIVEGAVKTPKIFDGAVTTDKLGDAAVTPLKLADLAVTTEKLGDLAVETDKIGAEAVTSPKIADQAVTTGKLANGAVTTPKLGTLVRRTGTPVTVPNNQSRLAAASCAAGERLITGGSLFPAAGNNTQAFTTHSFPLAGATEWRARGWNQSGANLAFQAFAVCLQP